MSEGKYNFSSKNGFCPQCLAFGRCWYIQDRFIGGSAYEYCLMSETNEKSKEYIFKSKKEIAKWLNEDESNIEYDESTVDYIISCNTDLSCNYYDKVIITHHGADYIYNKKHNTLTAMKEKKQETGWFDSYRECVKIAKEILCSIEKKEISMSTNFPLLIANGLKEYCATWGYPWLERLKEINTPEHFYKLFCKITKTYYVDGSTEYYNVTFSKEGTITVKKCGPDYDKRGPDAVLNIQDILPLLVGEDYQAANDKLLEKEAINKAICPVCGKEFYTSDGKEKYCSIVCSLWEELKNNMY